MRNTCIRSIATLLVLAAASGCGAPSPDTVEADLPPLVEAVEARQGTLPLEEIVPGTVRARNQVMVRPEIQARVVEVLARSGQAVERGEPLVRLDDDEPRERLRQAEASVRLAQAAEVSARARVTELETRVTRSRKLSEEDLISDQDLDILEAQLESLRAGAAEASARVEQAEATADERRSALAKTVVRSPVAGRLGERLVEEGMLVDPSTVLFVAGDLEELLVEVTLTERMLATVEEGQAALIELRAGTQEPLRARISRISPFLAADSFTTVGEIDLDNTTKSLLPGTFVNVRILVGESRRATLVPTAALWEDPATGRRGVYVVAAAEAVGLASGTATTVPAARSEAAGSEAASSEAQAATEPKPVSFRPVEILAEGRSAVAVTGIEQGSWVVTIGQHLLDSSDDSALRAQIRPVAWERVIELQSLQSEDLLEDFLDKQRRIAAALGAEIPESEDEVNRVLAASAETKTGSEGP